MSNLNAKRSSAAGRNVEPKPTRRVLSGRHMRDSVNEFLESAAGRKALDVSILRDLDMLKYLKNRIELTFIAGMQAAERLKDE